jgi:hypothetical protein
MLYASKILAAPEQQLEEIRRLDFEGEDGDGGEGEGGEGEGGGGGGGGGGVESFLRLRGYVQLMQVCAVTASPFHVSITASGLGIVVIFEIFPAKQIVCFIFLDIL